MSTLKDEVEKLRASADYYITNNLGWKLVPPATLKAMCDLLIEAQPHITHLWFHENTEAAREWLAHYNAEIPK